MSNFIIKAKPNPQVFDYLFNPMSSVEPDVLGGYLSKSISALHQADPILAAVARATYENPPKPLEVSCTAVSYF